MATLFATDSASNEYYLIAGNQVGQRVGSFEITKNAIIFLVGRGGNGGDVSVGGGGGSGVFLKEEIPPGTYNYVIDDGVSLTNTPYNVRRGVDGQNANGGDGGNGGGGNGGDGSGYGYGGEGTVTGGGGGELFGYGGSVEARLGTVYNWGVINNDFDSRRGTNGDGISGGRGGGDGGNGDGDGAGGGGGGGGGLYGGKGGGINQISEGGKGYGGGGSGGGGSNRRGGGGGGGFDPRIMYIYAKGLELMTEWSSNTLDSIINTNDSLKLTFFKNTTVVPAATTDGTGNPGAIFYVVLNDSPAPCLLPGTLIKTPTSYTPIENLQIGDVILSHQNKPVKVTYVEQAKVRYNECDHERCLSKKVFKMVKGTYGLTQDLYITRNHEVVIDGSLVLPETLCEQADPTEYCDQNGWFDIYNLRLEEDGNHLIVNGECVVVSLNSSTAPEPKKADADANGEPKLEPERKPEPKSEPKPRCKNPKCQGSVIKIK